MHDTVEIGLSLGSNLGDRLEHIQRGLDAIDAIAPIIARAAIYETEPVDVAAAHEDLPFLNTVVIVRSNDPPRELQARFQQIEAAMGRRPAGRNAPRTIDIDILYAGDHVVHEEGLTIPHPRWATRRFVVRR